MKERNSFNEHKAGKKDFVKSLLMSDTKNKNNIYGRTTVRLFSVTSDGAPIWTQTNDYLEESTRKNYFM